MTKENENRDCNLKKRKVNKEGDCEGELKEEVTGKKINKAVEMNENIDFKNKDKKGNVAKANEAGDCEGELKEEVTGKKTNKAVEMNKNLDFKKKGNVAKASESGGSKPSESKVKVEDSKERTLYSHKYIEGLEEENKLLRHQVKMYRGIVTHMKDVLRRNDQARADTLTELGYQGEDKDSQGESDETTLALLASTKKKLLLRRFVLSQEISVEPARIVKESTVKITT